MTQTTNFVAVRREIIALRPWPADGCARIVPVKQTGSTAQQHNAHGRQEPGHNFTYGERVQIRFAHKMGSSEKEWLPGVFIFSIGIRDSGCLARMVDFSPSWGGIGEQPDQLDGSASMAFDSKGMLFVGDIGNNQINIYAPPDIAIRE